MGESTLSEVTRWVWAKSDHDERGALTGWLPLHEHLRDSLEITAHLWEWLGPQRRRVLAAPLGEEGARRLVMFLAGVHDVGKASLPFAFKVPVLAEQMREHGLTWGTRPTPQDAAAMPHGLAGQVILERFLLERGLGRVEANQLACVVGGHHGVPPGWSELRRGHARDDLLGDESWRHVHHELLEDAVRRSGLDLAVLAGLRLGTPALALLSGTVIVADWLASNTALFPLAAPGRQLPSRNGRAGAAWERIDFPVPWRIVDGGDTAEELLASRFGLEHGARPVQQEALRLARDSDVPGIMVIEAPMGEGKTEAALLAAEVLAVRSGATGVVNALPTQATTNAMFMRMLAWLARVPDDELAGAASSRRSIALAHGKAMLNPTFRRLSIGAPSTGIGIDEPVSDGHPGESEAYVHGWMTSPKKTPLADFVVTTIDQVLFVALQARHLVLRHLGLAGKVVIIDEVHAYDAYMSVYLRRALEWLGAYGCPVVLLSATLPERQRAALVGAYLDGVASAETDLELASDPFPRWGAEPPSVPASTVGRAAGPRDLAYPAITVVRGGEVVTIPVTTSARRSEVRLTLADDGLEDLGVILQDALRDGGCAAVVRNTVRRAQETYARLRDLFGPEHVTLAHSQFLAADRARLDEELVRRFGPDGSNRPARHVVVATQVIEQSLDVDFDVLVTDLAPVDLVLQRMGRLHRHGRDRPAPVAEPRCLVVGAEWDADPPRPDPGSRAVYGEHALLRSAALLHARSRSDGVVVLPDDIAAWVETGYGDLPLGPPSWAEPMQRAHQAAQVVLRDKEVAAQAFRLAAPRLDEGSLNSWLEWSVGEADESARGRAQVRDSADSLEVLVLTRDSAGVVRVPPWLPTESCGGEPVPTAAEPPPDLAHAIASCALRLPRAESVSPRAETIIDELAEKWFFESWQRVPALRGQLVMVLDEHQDGTARAVVGGRWFGYSPELGFKVRAE